jgi:hypothetical protein
MISQRHIEKYSCQENDNDRSGGRAGEKLKMKMPLAEKPFSDVAKEGKTAALV